MESFCSKGSSSSSQVSKSLWNVSGVDCTLPDDRLPSDWQNDERMGFLFAPFYPRETNSKGYDAKMKFWTELLELWCSECGRASFSVSSLEKAFRRKNIRPACLQTFIEELERKGDIMKEEEFTGWDRTESWTTWAVKTVVQRPAVWSFSKLKEALISIDPSQIKYVSMTHLKAVGDRISRDFENNEDANVMTFGKFKELVGDDTEHVLRWLKNSGKATEVTFSEERWIKIGKGPIAEGEVTKHKLRHEISKMHASIDEWEESVSTLVDDARINIRNNKREAAKRCLKEKKSLQNRIKETSKIVDNLEALLSSLMTTKTNAEVLTVYQLGINSLKAAHSDLSEDAVANVMSELEDVLEMSHDVTRAMQLPSDVGDDDLEAELESIIADTSSPPPLSSVCKFPDLPNVPDSEPSPKRQVPELKSPEMKPLS